MDRVVFLIERNNWFPDTSVSLVVKFKYDDLYRMLMLSSPSPNKAAIDLQESFLIIG
jgi:hypothetical protein